MTPLRLVVFDFDQTLSACHVYYALSGGDSGGLRVPPPHARSERGQLARITELDVLPEFAKHGGFATAAFGGPQRVAALQALFDDLRAAGVECIVCSRGLVGPIRKCLDQVGLLGYFTQVFANAGGVPDGTDYDVTLPPGLPAGRDVHLLGRAENTGWGSKGRLVARCMRERNLQVEEAVFVDDTASEISNVQGICLTIHVQPAEGMGQVHLDQLRSLLPSHIPVVSGGAGAAPWGPEGLGGIGEPSSGAWRSGSGFDEDRGDRIGDRGDGGHAPPPMGQAAPSHDDDWYGTPQHPPPPPPPPPPPRRRDTLDGPMGGLPGMGPVCPASGGGEDMGLVDAKSFVHLGPWWGSGNEYGSAPPSHGVGLLQGQHGRGGPLSPNGQVLHRPPSNLYRDDDLPVPVCCWFHKGKRRAGPNQPPPCAMM
mmetsp:Transcript_97938/g.255532  ORF Transcript_97938/g.255532 Transcript_97938/m.255532 type:complete len:424 (+) Transcript_97938:98-1369(+)